MKNDGLKETNQGNCLLYYGGLWYIGPVFSGLTWHIIRAARKEVRRWKLTK